MRVGRGAQNRCPGPRLEKKPSSGIGRNDRGRAERGSARSDDIGSWCFCGMRQKREAPRPTAGDPCAGTADVTGVLPWILPARPAGTETPARKDRTGVVWNGPGMGAPGPGFRPRGLYGIGREAVSPPGSTVKVAGTVSGLPVEGSLWKRSSRPV